MTNLQTRVDLVHRWFINTVNRTETTAGWGWVPDVPPNPQNTAEVVCAIGDADLELPYRSEIMRLIRTPVVDSPRGDWVFEAPLDLAWRVRALRYLGVAADDAGLSADIDALLKAQLGSGGWPMASGLYAPSATATAAAVLALAMTSDDRALAMARRGLEHLTTINDNGRDHQRGPVHVAAYTAFTLSRPEVRALGSERRFAQARDLACDRLMRFLATRRYEAEEETFSRGRVLDTFRHLTLPIALRAVAAARPEALFEPPFRDALVALLALQDTTPTHVTYGGFRTSPEGFVTSYASTQALEVLASIRKDLSDYVNPAVAFDLICHSNSAHHTDPQTLARLGNRSLIMNSTAALSVMVLAVFAGGGLAAAGAMTRDAASPSVSRAFLVFGSLLAGLGISCYLSTRLHRTPIQRISLVAFTLFTALVLPALMFILY
jgi:hypothetical protein